MSDGTGFDMEAHKAMCLVQGIADLAKHIEKKGDYCPVCQSTGVSRSNRSNHDEKGLESCECIDCGSHWTDHFIIEHNGYSDLHIRGELRPWRYSP